jgi:hypothetical protein
MQNIQKGKETFRQQRQKRSVKLFVWGWVVQIIGILVLVLAFGPLRTMGGSGNTLELIATYIGLIVTTCGMLLNLVGAFGGFYYASLKNRQLAYLAATLGAAAEIVGFAWDNVLHVLGYDHFDEAHRTAEIGLVLLVLASLYLWISGLLTRQTKPGTTPQS